MIKILIAYSGGGKTYKLMREIAGKYPGHQYTNRKIFVIERKEYNEYSGLFHPDYVHVLKPTDDISFLKNETNCDIYIDCEYYEESFLEEIATIIKRARINHCNITVTFLQVYNLSEYEITILGNADEILVGKCSLLTEVEIKKCLA